VRLACRSIVKAGAETLGVPRRETGPLAQPERIMANCAIHLFWRDLVYYRVDLCVGWDSADGILVLPRSSAPQALALSAWWPYVFAFLPYGRSREQTIIPSVAKAQLERRGGFRKTAANSIRVRSAIFAAQPLKAVRR
jgi:hypothetical protein